MVALMVVLRVDLGAGTRDAHAAGGGGGGAAAAAAAAGGIGPSGGGGGGGEAVEGIVDVM